MLCIYLYHSTRLNFNFNFNSNSNISFNVPIILVVDKPVRLHRLERARVELELRVVPLVDEELAVRNVPVRASLLQEISQGRNKVIPPVLPNVDDPTTHGKTARRIAWKTEAFFRGCAREPADLGRGGGRVVPFTD